jgi:hypothetical protein
VLTLKVTPQITDAGTVILELEVENNSPDYANRVNGIPPINTQSAKTIVLVKDGATAVVGGIYQSAETTTNNQTPFLSKIPGPRVPLQEQGRRLAQQRAAVVHHAAHRQVLEGERRAMWFRLLSRDGRVWTMRLGAAFGVALALAMAGCSADYVEGNRSTVLLTVEAVNEGAPILSDVRGLDEENPETIVNCQTDVAVSVRTKNPTQPAAPVQDVRLTRYEVSYRRSDGRGVQGVDVPYTISGNMTVIVSAGGDTTSFPIDLVRHQAKLLPPLSNITGLQIVTMFADVTLSGATISGSNVSAQGSVQVTFADYAAGTDVCETGS